MSVTKQIVSIKKQSVSINKQIVSISKEIVSISKEFVSISKTFVSKEIVSNKSWVTIYWSVNVSARITRCLPTSFVVDVIPPKEANLNKTDICEKLTTMYKVKDVKTVRGWSFHRV